MAAIVNSFFILLVFDSAKIHKKPETILTIISGIHSLFTENSDWFLSFEHIHGSSIIHTGDVHAILQGVHTPAVQREYPACTAVAIGSGALDGRGRIGMVVGVVLEIAEAPVAVGEVERAASIAMVDGADGFHLSVSQREVEDADVFEDMVGIGGAGDGASSHHC